MASRKPFNRLRVIRDHSSHGGSELLMLYALFSHCDERGEAYPSRATLAREARINVRQAQTLLNNLKASGEITVASKRGLAGTSLYRINFDVIERKPSVTPGLPRVDEPESFDDDGKVQPSALSKVQRAALSGGSAKSTKCNPTSAKVQSAAIQSAVECTQTTRTTRTTRTRRTRTSPSAQSEASGTSYPHPSAELNGAQEVDADELPEGPPDCPHTELLALYAKYLPELAQPRVWNKARAETMRARWRDCAKPSQYSQGYRTKDEGLTFWDKFFAFVAYETRLPQGFPSKLGGHVWQPDLPWLVKAENFAKVIEGKYSTTGPNTAAAILLEPEPEPEIPAFTPEQDERFAKVTDPYNLRGKDYTDFLRWEQLLGRSLR